MIFLQNNKCINILKINLCNNFKKMFYYNNLIKYNNEVIFIPYMHGNFNNNNFYLMRY